MSAYRTPTGPVRPTALDATLGHAVARHRMDAGMDQYSLADMLTEATGQRWTQSLLSKIELGARPVRLSEAYALAAAFDTTVDALTGHAQEDARASQTFAQLAENRRLQRQLRLRERDLLDNLNNTSTRSKTA